MMFACNTNSIFCASLNVFLLVFPSTEEWIPPELNGDQILCPWLSTSRTMVVFCVFYQALMRAKMKQILSNFWGNLTLPSVYSVLVARRDATTTRVKVRLIRWVCDINVYVYRGLWKRTSVEYACGTLNHSIDDNSSRTHGTRTASRSCEYACGLSNY